jgi:hypothetical protein
VVGRGSGSWIGMEGRTLVSTPSMLCALRWGLARMDTSITLGPSDPEFFFFFLEGRCLHYGISYQNAKT